MKLHPGAAVLLLCSLFSACVVKLQGNTSESPPRPPEPRRSVAASAAAPTPVGPYSQGIRVGSTLYLSGQIGLDPTSGELVAGGIAPQTRQALANLGAVLASEGMSVSDVVEVQVFLADMADYAAMNAVYAETFKSSAPARTTVGVSALPLGAAVEIRAMAVRAR